MYLLFCRLNKKIYFCSIINQLKHKTIKHKIMKASDWISVKDRLPRNNEYVLTSNGIGVWCCLQMFSDGIWIAYDGRTYKK